MKIHAKTFDDKKGIIICVADRGEILLHPKYGVRLVVTEDKQNRLECSGEVKEFIEKVFYRKEG